MPLTYFLFDVDGYNTVHATNKIHHKQQQYTLISLPNIQILCEVHHFVVFRKVP